MIVIPAHVAGMPVEEFVPSFAGAGLLLARTWLMPRLRRRRTRSR